MKHAFSVGIAAALVIGFPQTAHACAVCFDANGEVRVAFIVTTVFLSLLPLGMVGGLGLWMRKRFREMEQTDEATPEVPFDE